MNILNLCLGQKQERYLLFLSEMCHSYSRKNAVDCTVVIISIVHVALEHSQIAPKS